MDSILHFYSNLVDSIPFHTLTQAQSSSLEAPITLEEIERALKSFSKHKTPGPDGFLMKWYLAHWDSLLPRLCALYKAIFKAQRLPSSLREALIVLIPKPKKDLQYCDS